MVDLLPKKAQARAAPCTVVPWVITVLLLMVPPALCKVEPKTARKMMGAMIDLKPKKYCTLVYGMQRKGSCSRKYSRKPIMPCVVMPSEAGMLFGTFAKLGHMARSKTVMHCPPVVV